MILQVIAIAFILFAASRVFLRFKDKHLSLWEFVFWTVLWTVAVVIILLPQTSSVLAKMLGVGRGVDAVLYISILILFYGMFRLYVKLEHIEKEITDIVRKIGIQNLKSDKDKERNEG